MSFPMQPDIPRDHWTRPLVVPPNGGKRIAYTRATTYADALDEKYKLSQWQQRMVAIGIAQRRDLAMGITALTPELITKEASPKAKNDANDICQRAIDVAQGTAAATIGTALHTLTENLDRGLPLGPVPSEVSADLKAYQEATSCLRSIHVEQFCVIDDLKIGGTPDRVVEYQGHTYIADLKTGSIEWGALKIALQLAIYAHSVMYDTASNSRKPLPHVDKSRAIVIHMPAGSGTCTLHWIDIKRGWDAIPVAGLVRQWRATRGWLSPFGTDVPLPFEMDDTASLRDEIANAQDVQALGELWGKHRAIWDNDLTDLAAARKAVLAGGLA